jgi:hypothetical protein
MKKWILGFALLFSLVACKEDDSKKSLLLGKWKGAAWKVNGKDAGRDASGVNFEFQADDLYTAAYGEQREKGSFRLAGDKLYTTAENKIEKMVKLAVLTADSLVMDMNRAGENEQLILKKK